MHRLHHYMYYHGRGDYLSSLLLNCTKDNGNKKNSAKCQAKEYCRRKQTDFPMNKIFFRVTNCHVCRILVSFLGIFSKHSV